LNTGNTITLKAETDGERLDKWIPGQRPEISRTQAQRLIEEGRVTVNGSPSRASQRITAGDSVSILLVPPRPTTLVPEDMPISIVYEDDDLLVVDKPAGLTVHPAPGHPEHTLANAILSHLPQVQGTGDATRPGIVHRLDKDTSGLIIVAKTPQAHKNLTDQFKRREVKKVYLALVRGDVRPDEGIIEAPVGRDRGRRERMAITDKAHGREARTSYKVLKHVQGYTLVEARPETGRTHQIRVHLAAIGYPIVGDRTYGVTSSLVDRQFLHAHRISFVLPSSGKTVQFQSELPADLQRALDAVQHS
jgi:23S rRNA pseudouridine1911/1915/1917 synthase